MKILLGYEIGTGKEVNIQPSHLIVTGITQLSGKTTTLEALITRSNLKAIVFKTKIGEKSFSHGTIIPPFFRDRSDYEFIKSLIEAYAKEKLFLEKGTLMRLCQGAVSLLEIKKRVDDTIVNTKLRGIKEEIYTRLQHYLESIIPQIQYANLSKTLSIYEGINIMDIQKFTEEVQSLIIQSVANEVLNTQKDIIIVIPEAWKFLPQKYNNPCKREVEKFIRQGAANGNYIWIDSQDMAGVDKQPLKQVSTWILGYQSERNEVKHTLDQISLPSKVKPTEDQIMRLGIGQFYLSTNDVVKLVYVRPLWLDEHVAKNIALGKISVKDAQKPDRLIPYGIPSQHSKADMPKPFHKDMQKELIELRNDFFAKIQELQNFNNKVVEEIYKLSNKPEISVDEIVSKVLQKMPVHQNNAAPIDEKGLIERIIARLPRSAGSVTYEVEPLEKLKKDFLEDAKKKIMADVSTLDEEQKKILKFVETQGKTVKLGFIIGKCLYMSESSGGTRDRVSKRISEIAALDLLRKDTAHGLYYPNLEDRIKALLEPFSGTNDDIKAVYNHIIAEML